MIRGLALCALIGCGNAAAPVPAGGQLGPALVAAFAAAREVAAPWRCAAADGPTLTSETLGAWRLAGHTLLRDGDELTIAVIADAGGAAAPTIAAIGRMRDKLNKVDVVLALGGMGTTEAELVATLGAIADKGPLVVALPGDLEDAGALTSAIAALRARGITAVDGRLAQRLEADGVTIALIAGAGARGRTVAGAEGCVYAAADAAAALASLDERPGVRVVASAEAPRQQRAGEATGELALTATTGVDIALHGAGDAASRATKGARDGDAIALTPGSLDATPRLPGGTRTASAGILAIRGASWTWKPLVDE